MIVLFQVLWAIGCIAWNLYGLYLINQGQPAIGPTASAAGAVVCAAFAFLFWWLTGKQKRLPYIVISAIAALMAGFTIYGSFTKDPSLWPSEEWRWAGIILNGIGVMACIAGITKTLNNKNQTS